MATSFTPTHTGALAQSSTQKRCVLVTGAAGNIGGCFARTFSQTYDLRLMVQNPEEAREIAGFGEVVSADLSEISKIKEFCEGIDTVLHLAANGSPNQTWASVVENNITGTYNTFVAAKAAGCRRVIFASSIHAVSGYPRDVQVKTSEAVNPGDLYGVSKCFGEALGRYMAEQENLSVFAIRIGGFGDLESAQKEDIKMMDGWVSQRDLMQLFQKCIEVENVKWAILHGLSDNSFKRLDISDARELVGYAPQDDFSALNPRLRALNLAESVAEHSMKDGEQSGLRDELEVLQS